MSVVASDELGYTSSSSMACVSLTCCVLHSLNGSAAAL
jgi:hypothetical protein